MMDYIQKVTGKRKDNDEYVTGSLMYDFDQDCWRIITYFFDIEAPKLDNQFGVCAYEIDINTVTKRNLCPICGSDSLITLSDITYCYDGVKGHN